MSKRSYLLVWILVFPLMIKAQTMVQGNVLDSQTQLPISYVNIGVVGKNMGTVSAPDGSFELNLKGYGNQDSIRFSTLGYEDRTYGIFEIIQKLKGHSKIFLSKTIEELPSLVISGKRMKPRVLGEFPTSKLISAGFETNDLGREVGKRFKLKNGPGILKEVHVAIAENEFDTLRFRLNIYSLQDGLPADHLINENIVFSVTNVPPGTLTIDVSKYNIVVQEDFIVSLEWIEDMGSGELRFSCRVYGQPIFYRYTSQDQWHKSRRGSIGLAVTILE